MFSGRAAYIETGVLIGTIMTGNVWFVIVPSQRALVAATMAGKDQDPKLSLQAKARSIHNNYLTFPLIFIMCQQSLLGRDDAPPQLADPDRRHASVAPACATS